MYSFIFTHIDFMFKNNVINNIILRTKYDSGKKYLNINVLLLFSLNVAKYSDISFPDSANLLQVSCVI